MDDILSRIISWQGQQLGVLVYLLVVQVNTVLNALDLRRLGAHDPPSAWPAVAVLVPARNEEATIAACVRSLQCQEYPSFAVWVLDDQSTDGTAAILAEEAARSPQLRVLAGAPLPLGWLGKPWACHQLAQAVDAEVLVFVDSDTWHHPRMLRDAVAALLAEEAGMLSVLPRQVMRTPPEWLAVPIIPWSLLTHYPLALAQRFGWRTGAAALGQVLLFRRQAYEATGGHAAVRREVAEDLALARAAAERGIRWRVVDGKERSACRMYRSAAAVREGLGKNLVAAFGGRVWLYLFVWVWLAVAFILPPIELTGALLAGLPISAPLAAGAVLLAAGIWGVTVLRLRLPLTLVLLYPAVMTVAFLLACESLRQALTKRATWKGRRVRP
jgi:chlorobactene glucosyltransferase